jgi:hypothetical protein
MEINIEQSANERSERSIFYGVGYDRYILVHLLVVAGVIYVIIKSAALRNGYGLGGYDEDDFNG